MRSTFLETLESRTMMSVAPASLSLNATVQADRLQVRVDLQKFRADAFGCTAKLLGDVSAIRSDHLKDDATLLPLVKQMRSDIGHMRLTLRVDRLNEATNVLADESKIVAELKQMLLDRGDAAALAADRSQLLADRIKLQQDMIAGLDARIADRQSGFTTVFNDGQAILAALQSDPNASPKLSADAGGLSEIGAAMLSAVALPAATADGSYASAPVRRCR